MAQFINKTVGLVAIILIVLIMVCSGERALIVPSSNPEIRYWGRMDTTQTGGVNLYWSGTSIKMNFRGTSIKALLKDETGDNYYNVIIDHDSAVLLRPDTTKSYYQLATQLPQGDHAVEIFKRTEWDRGKTTFYGFEIEKGATLLPKPVPKKRKIEFYGNSITAGYAVEDYSGGDSPDSTYTNNYLSYSAITARHYDAQYQCICKSGIGITISWFPLIMPDIYDRLNPSDPSSVWDFSLYKPDVVVINLLQNDSWLVGMPERKEFKTNFGTRVPNDGYFIQAYQRFVSSIRHRYPKASIICMLGNMDITKKGSKWIEFVKTAVANLRDDKIYPCIVPFKGTPGHPSIQEQENLANSLIECIDAHVDW